MILTGITIVLAGLLILFLLALSIKLKKDEMEESKTKKLKKRVQETNNIKKINL